MNPFLTADYRDGRVRIGNKTYAAGVYAVHLLNQYHGLASPDTADKTYRKALQKMKEKLKDI